MPITQDRFLAIINGASSLVEKMTQAHQIARPGDETIINANSLLEHTQDESVREVVTALLNDLQRVRSTLDEIMIDSVEVRAAIIIEREHFRKYARKNAKAAHYAHEQRVNRGGSVIPRQQGPVHEGLPTTVTPKRREEPRLALQTQAEVDNDPAFLAFQEQQRKKWESEQTASPKGEGAAAATHGEPLSLGEPLMTNTTFTSTTVDGAPRLVITGEPIAAWREWLGLGAPPQSELNKPDFEGDPFAEGAKRSES